MFISLDHLQRVWARSGDVDRLLLKMYDHLFEVYPPRFPAILESTSDGTGTGGSPEPGPAIRPARSGARAASAGCYDIEQHGHVRPIQMSQAGGVQEEEKRMLTVRDHINKPVVTTSEGRKLGKIRDLYLDAKLTRVAAVYLGTSGVLGRKKLMIDRDKVRTFGADAWLVDSADVVVDRGQIVGARYFVPARQLRRRKILSEGGTEIATVEDVILDNQCYVKGFSLANYPSSGPLGQRKAIALGAFTSLGGKKSPMVTTLARAESMEVTSQD